MAAVLSAEKGENLTIAKRREYSLPLPLLSSEHRQTGS
jgi:hypothetical protein